MPDTWEYGDIADFRARAEASVRQHFRALSTILKRWSKDNVAEISGFEAIRHVFAEYFLYSHWDNHPRIHNMRDAIFNIKSGAEALNALISDLDDATSNTLRRAADRDKRITFDPAAPNKGWCEAEAPEIEDVIGAITTLSRWAETALQETGEPPLGRPPRNANLRATRLLAGLYEQLTGLEPFKRTIPTTGAEENGAFRTFVNEIMDIVGVKVKDATVRQAKDAVMAKREEKLSDLTPLDAGARITPR